MSWTAIRRIITVVSCAGLLVVATGCDNGDGDEDGEVEEEEAEEKEGPSAEEESSEEEDSPQEVGWEYEIGDDGPAGGYVFYIDEDDEHDWTYLELADESVDEGTEFIWGGRGTEVGGDAQGDGVGDGAGNTAAIIEKFGDEEPDSDQDDYAARIADKHEVEYEGETFDDWFLPSMGELTVAHDHLDEVDVGDFVFTFSWSSTEKDDETASRVRLDRGTDTGGPKHGTNEVRPVRSF